mgnify:CR=1 FL=1
MDFLVGGKSIKSSTRSPILRCPRKKAGSAGVGNHIPHKRHLFPSFPKPLKINKRTLHLPAGNTYIASAMLRAAPNQPNQHCLIRSYAKHGQIFIKIQPSPKCFILTLRVTTHCFYEELIHYALRPHFHVGDYFLRTHKKNDLFASGRRSSHWNV